MKALMHERHVHPEGIKDWQQVREMKGIGDALFAEIVVLCRDPSTTAIESDEQTQQQENDAPTEPQTENKLDHNRLRRLLLE